MVAAAMVGAAVVGAAASSSASSKAAKSQRAGADAATQSQEDMYYQTREDQAPWRDTGLGALGQINRGLGAAPQAVESYEAIRQRLAPNYATTDGNGVNDAALDAAAKYELNLQTQRKSQMEASGSGTALGDFNRDFTLADFQKDPGYDFRLNQGLDAVQGSRAARGSMLSGSTLKALSDYGSDYASSEYGKAYDRFNNDRAQRFNRLATVAGIGQTATNNVGTAGANAANNISSNQIGAANAQAAGYVGQANALNGGLSNLQSLYQLNQMNNRGTSGYTSSYSINGGSGLTANNDGFYSSGTDGTAQLPWGG